MMIGDDNGNTETLRLADALGAGDSVVHGDDEAGIFLFLEIVYDGGIEAVAVLLPVRDHESHM